MPLISFNAGQRLRAARLNAAFDLRRERIQLNDQLVNNSTVLVSSNDLVLSVEANSTYVYRAQIVFDSNSTADFKHALLVPAGAIITRHGTWTPTTSATATNTTIAVDAVDATGFNSGGVSGGTMMTLRPSAILSTVGTAGNLTIQFAQAVANASNTILKAGSWVELVKTA